jgi:hypothetical protein
MSEHDEQDVVFQVPVPPGPPPPHFPPVPPHAPNMLYVRERLDSEGRDFEDLMLRKVPRETAMRFRAAAGGRALTYAQYLTALTALHEAIRAAADDGDERAKAELERLGLTTVNV